MPDVKKSKAKFLANEHKIVLASEFLKKASEPIRMRILLILSDGERNVGEICEEMKYEQSAVSHQLRLMRHGGLLVPRRVGKNVFYSLTDSGKSLSNVVNRIIATLGR
jgi:DNA-binding transcriptional ArsR family regulator